MPESSPTVPGRRLVLGGMSAIVLLGVAGCGVRLEEDAPDLPLIPRRSPMAGEVVLLALLADTLGLVRATSAGATDTERSLADLHVRQERVLRDTLRRGGVPSGVVGTATPSASAPASLVAMEAAAAADRTRYADLGLGIGRVVVSMLAQRLAAATVLSSQVALATPAASPSGSPSPASVTPTPSPSSTASESPTASSDAAAVGAILTAAREAAHWFEVAAARAARTDDPTRERERIEAVATWLRRRMTVWESTVGTAAPEAPLAIPLPFPVDSVDSRRRLVAQGLEGVRAAYGRRLDALDPAGLDTAWADLPEDLADIEVHVHEWGGALQAFPGLS